MKDVFKYKYNLMWLAEGECGEAYKVEKDSSLLLVPKKKRLPYFAADAYIIIFTKNTY